MTNDSARRQTVKKNDRTATTPSAEPLPSVEEALAIASRLMQDMAISMVEHAASEARKNATVRAAREQADQNPPPLHA